MKPAGQNFCLAALSVVFSLAVMECGLRLHHYGTLLHLSGEHRLRVPHPTRGWTLAPNGAAFQQSRDYAVTVRTNSHGLRDRPHAYEPAPGAVRIVVLGDSFMEAYQVDLEESLPYRLQESLGPPVEVVNLGVGGYGTAQQYLYLRDEGLRYRPRIVILAFYMGNDVHNNSQELQRRLWGEDNVKSFGRPYATTRDLAQPLTWRLPEAARLEEAAERTRRKRERFGYGIVKHLLPSVVYGYGERLAAQMRPGRDSNRRDPRLLLGWPFLRDPGLDAEWREAWRSTRRLILETRDLARGDDAHFLLVLVPAAFQIETERLRALEAAEPGLALDVTRINRALLDFTSEHDIPMLDLTEAFRAENARAPRTLYHQLEDRHWSGPGHALATREIGRFLAGSGWLEPARTAGSGRHGPPDG